MPALDTAADGEVAAARIGAGTAGRGLSWLRERLLATFRSWMFVLGAMQDNRARLAA